LGFVRIVQVQSATGDGLAGRIEKQEVKSGFFGRIALAPARLAPGCTQDPPAQIEVNIPIGGGTGAAKNQLIAAGRHNIRQYMSYKIATKLDMSPLILWVFAADLSRFERVPLPRAIYGIVV
jgi:hypothetical protein